MPWIKKNFNKKVQEQQGPRRTTKYNGLQERVGRDRPWQAAPSRARVRQPNSAGHSSGATRANTTERQHIQQRQQHRILTGMSLLAICSPPPSTRNAVPSVAQARQPSCRWMHNNAASVPGIAAARRERRAANSFTAMPGVSSPRCDRLERTNKAQSNETKQQLRTLAQQMRMGARHRLAKPRSGRHASHVHRSHSHHR